MSSKNNNVSSVNNSDMDTDPLNSGSDSETVKDKVKSVKVDLSNFNKNIVQCWECESTFRMDTPLWCINQMNTKKIQCKLTGIVLLFIGVAVLVRYIEYGELITNRFSNLAGFTVATGVIILLGSSLGFYGAISQHFYVIGAYVILQIVVLVFEVSITIVGFQLSNGSATEIRSTMVTSLQQYRTKIEVMKLWDDLQMEFECCGVTGRFDWTPVNEIPVSCCHIDYGTISPFDCNLENSYATGCAAALGEYLGDQAYTIGVAALVMTCIQVVLTALSAYLAWRSKYEEIDLES